MNKDCIEFNECEFPLIFGEDNFIDLTKGVDFIAGPKSNAIIEARLINIDYYTFAYAYHKNYSEFILPALDEVVNISYNMADLKE